MLGKLILATVPDSLKTFCEHHITSGRLVEILKQAYFESLSGQRFKQRYALMVSLGIYADTGTFPEAKIRELCSSFGLNAGRTNRVVSRFNAVTNP